MQISWQAQHLVNLEVQISWQVQHLVSLEVQISWQAQRLVNLEVQISWQAQHLVNLEVQISWQVERLVSLEGQISWQAQRLVNLEVQISWQVTISFPLLLFPCLLLSVLSLWSPCNRTNHGAHRHGLGSPCTKRNTGHSSKGHAHHLQWKYVQDGPYASRGRLDEKRVGQGQGYIFNLLQLSHEKAC